MGEEKFKNLSFFELMELFKKCENKEEKDFFIKLANKSLKRDFENFLKSKE